MPRFFIFGIILGFYAVNAQAGVSVTDLVTSVRITGTVEGESVSSEKADAKLDVWVNVSELNAFVGGGRATAQLIVALQKVRAYVAATPERGPKEAEAMTDLDLASELLDRVETHRAEKAKAAKR